MFRRAVELDPLNPHTYVDLARALDRSGRLQQADATVRRALELDPNRQFAHILLGKLRLQESKPEAALAEMQREPELSWRLFGLVLAYHALGRSQESDRALQDLMAYQNVMAYQLADAYAFRGQSDLVFDWLERAYAQRDAGLMDIKGNPFFKNLERDPRYAALLKKMRLPAD